MSSYPYLGKYKGFVRDNADPEGRGRLRVYCPQVMGKMDTPDRWLGWALPCLPWLGEISTVDFGVPLTKEQNDGKDVGVWIEFEGGEPDFPIWVGTFVVAPTPTDDTAKGSLESFAGGVGGSLIGNPPSGSQVGAINPPAPVVKSKECRLLAKKGHDMIIGIAGGGHIVLGQGSADIVAPMLRLNGLLILPNPDEPVD